MIDDIAGAPTTPQPRRSPGSNSKQKRLARLRSTALDELESPLDRLEAARQILKRHGISDRNIPIVRKVLKLYLKSRDGDLAYRASKIKARLAKLLELKAVKLPDDIENTEIEIAPDCTDLKAIALEPEMIQPPDPWDAPPPLPLDEQFRLIECQRSSVTGRALLSLALDGRDPTIENLKTLFEHMAKSCGAGGCSLTDGPLYAELKKTLISYGAIPADSHQPRQSLMDELNARG